jgi:cyclophilin family peptidyl-prolyl cis-trans isomerase
MAAKKRSSSRKRSRPVEKRSKFTKIKKNKILIGVSLVVIAIVAVAAIYVYIGIGSDNEGNPVAIIDTSMGTIKVELYEDKVPNTCENFINLANDGFYDGVIFHRIKDDFMIQAGRDTQDGEIKTSPYGNIEFETHDDVKHVDGAISMASTDARVGGSAEFFICDGAQSGLDGNYAAFGVVVEGMDVLQAIAAAEHDGSLEPTPENPYLPGGGKPLVDIIINSIIIENQ